VSARSSPNSARKVLANDVVQEVLLDALPEGLPAAAGKADLAVHPIPLAHLDRPGLEGLSKAGGLALDGLEMQTIQAHFATLGRAPSRLELETLAQTWSEHCKHKTLTGNVTVRRSAIENLLKSTIAHVTHTLARDFCVSVFVDNAGIIKFDDETRSASRSRRTTTRRRSNRSAAPAPASAA
jgi:hypothetical protein